MADQQNVTIDAAGCLGRVFTAVGVVWLMIAILVSLGVLNRSGFGGGVIAVMAGSIFPALLLIAAGRALRRRSRLATTNQQIPSPQPGRSPKRVPTSRVEPAQKAPLPPPPPVTQVPTPVVQKPAPRPAETMAPIPEPTTSSTPAPSVPAPVTPPSRVPGSARSAAPPKTSRELIEEAHKRWGIKTRR